MTEIDTKALTEEWKALRAEQIALDEEWWLTKVNILRDAEILAREAEVIARIAEIDALLPVPNVKYKVRYIKTEIVEFEVESIDDWRTVEQQLAAGALAIQPSALVGNGLPQEAYRLVDSEIVR